MSRRQKGKSNTRRVEAHVNCNEKCDGETRVRTRCINGRESWKIEKEEKKQRFVDETRKKGQSRCIKVATNWCKLSVIRCVGSWKWNDDWCNVNQVNRKPHCWHEMKMQMNDCRLKDKSKAEDKAKDDEKIGRNWLRLERLAFNLKV